jgi:hypothetical protein
MNRRMGGWEDGRRITLEPRRARGRRYAELGAIPSTRLEAQMLFAMTLLLAGIVSGAADIGGRWQGTVVVQREDGSSDQDSVLMILTQKDATITGTVGGREDDQFPITKGSIEGSKVTFQATNPNNGREYLVELLVDGDEMKGVVTMGQRKADLKVKKMK